MQLTDLEMTQLSYSNDSNDSNDTELNYTQTDSLRHTEAEEKDRQTDTRTSIIRTDHSSTLPTKTHTHKRRV